MNQPPAGPLLPAALSQPSPRARQRSLRWPLGLGLLGGLSLLLIGMPILKGSLSAQSTAQSTAENTRETTAGIDNTLPVETITAQKVSRYDVARTYTGEIATLQASELGFERSGQLTTLRVPEGARVQAGDPLAQLDIQNLQTQRLQIEAEKSQALAQ
ncbi:MAG: biotin/lipoyl-binding protein, partial [Cyanobacteria bacterium J06555_13]